MGLPDLLQNQRQKSGWFFFFFFSLPKFELTLASDCECPNRQLQEMNTCSIKWGLYLSVYFAPLVLHFVKRAPLVLGPKSYIWSNKNHFYLEEIRKPDHKKGIPAMNKWFSVHILHSRIPNTSYFLLTCRESNSPAFGERSPAERPFFKYLPLSRLNFSISRHSLECPA